MEFFIRRLIPGKGTKIFNEKSQLPNALSNWLLEDKIRRLSASFLPWF
jgi:hypothetical protein